MQRVGRVKFYSGWHSVISKSDASLRLHERVNSNVAAYSMKRYSYFLFHFVCLSLDSS